MTNRLLMHGWFWLSVTLAAGGWFAVFFRPDTNHPILLAVVATYAASTARRALRR